MYSYWIIKGSKGLEDNPEDELMTELTELGFSPTDIDNTDTGYLIQYKSFKSDNYEGRSLHDLMLETMSTIELDGKTLREAVRDYAQSDERYMKPIGEANNQFKYTASDDTVINDVRTIFNEYKLAARKQVIDEYGEDFINKDGETILEAREREEIAKEDFELDAEVQQNIRNIRRF